MFDQFCALLLRLYPAEFQQTYGREAVQLMRDRARHERGAFLRVRLLMDLTIDLGVTLFHGWHSSPPPLARLDRPRFDITDIRGPRPAALAVGMSMSILMFVTFTLVLQADDVSNRYAARNSSKLAHRPVYVPTSSATQSAAEYFVYSLKMLRRAMAVGETPAGLVEETVASPAVAQSPAFDVISIKADHLADPRNMRMRVLPNGDLHASGVPVLWLLRYAYDVPVNPSPRLSGLPGWGETYDIEAKAPANAIPADLPEHERRGRTQGMIRGLLADRFKLVMRVEQKTMLVYVLTVASGGPTLQKSTIAEKDCTFDTGTPESCHTFVAGRGHPLSARAITMDDLALYIENWADLPVVNRTAVSGLFAVETEGWTPMRLPPPPPGNPPAARFDDLPTIFTVLRKLGLELQKQEGKVPVYTVEHIERPAAHADDAR